MAETFDDVDFALAAYHEGDSWQVAELTHDHVTDVETLVHALRRFPGERGAIGLIAVDEDFFLIVRVDAGRARLLLSDVSAAEEWELASSAVDYLRLPEPDDDDEGQPAGDLDLLGDLGMRAPEIAVLLDDADLYPDEILSEVARSLGFGALFDDTVGLTSA